jgi:hypothetical protein
MAPPVSELARERGHHAPPQHAVGDDAVQEDDRWPVTCLAVADRACGGLDFPLGAKSGGVDHGELPLNLVVA